MSAQIDYTTIAIITISGGFFGAFGAEIGRYFISEIAKYLKKRSEEIKSRVKEMME